MKKKICVFCSLPSFNTGMPISTYKLAAGLVSGGRFDVRAVLPEEGELGMRMRAAGVHVDIVPFYRLRAKPARILRFAARYVFAAFRFFKYIRDNNVDIVHFSDIIDAPFYPVARLAGAKVVAHVRVCAGGAVAGRFFRVWASLFCTRIIAISKYVKRHFKLGGKRVSVIYNPGPDRKIFNAEREAGYHCLLGDNPRILEDSCVSDNFCLTDNLDTPDDTPLVIAIASFRKEKGHHNFLEIASLLTKRLSGKIKFAIVGGEVQGHEKYYKEIMEEIRRKGLDKYLAVTGNVPHEQVASIMAKADVLLHVPDWEEAFGGVALEAMAMGATVVAYKRGGVGECFTDGVSGFLVEYGRVDEAVNKVTELLKNPKLRGRVADEARKELDEKFTPARYVNEIEKIYGEI